jgi:hypothetical protein
MVSTKDYNDRRYWEWPPRDAAPASAVIDPKALPAPAVPEAVILSGYVPAIVVDNADPMTSEQHDDDGRRNRYFKRNDRRRKYRRASLAYRCGRFARQGAQ